MPEKTFGARCNRAVPDGVYPIGKVVMGIDKEQENRLISGETPVDDPTWGEVSAFLEAVDAAYADTSAAQYEAAIVAAVSHEARSIRNAPQTNRRTRMKDLFTIKTHRLLIGSVIAAVVALTAGVGVAAATGTGPLVHLLPAAGPETTAPVEEPTVTASPTEDPSATTSDDDADDQSEAEDESGDDSTSTPSATPTSHRSDDEADDDEGDDDSDHSSADSSHDSDSDEAEDEADDEAEDEAEDESDDSSEHQTAESSHDDSVDDSSDDSGDDDSED